MTKETFVWYPQVYAYVDPFFAPQVYAYAPTPMLAVPSKVYGPYGRYTYGPY